MEVTKLLPFIDFMVVCLKWQENKSRTVLCQFFWPPKGALESQNWHGKCFAGVTMTCPHLSLFLEAKAMKEWRLKRLKSPVSLFQSHKFHVFWKIYLNLSEISPVLILLWASQTPWNVVLLFLRLSTIHFLLFLNVAAITSAFTILASSHRDPHFFRVYLDFLLMFCAASKTALETHLNAV